MSGSIGDTGKFDIMEDDNRLRLRDPDVWVRFHLKVESQLLTLKSPVPET